MASQNSLISVDIELNSNRESGLKFIILNFPCAPEAGEEVITKINELFPDYSTREKPGFIEIYTDYSDPSEGERLAQEILGKVKEAGYYRDFQLDIGYIHKWQKSKDQLNKEIANLVHGVRMGRGPQDYNLDFRVKSSSIDIIFDPYDFYFGGEESHIYVGNAVIGVELDYVTLERADEGLVIIHISPAGKLAAFNAHLKHRLEGKRIWEGPRICAEVLVNSIDDSIPVLAEYTPELKITGEPVGKSRATNVMEVSLEIEKQVS